MRLICWNVNSIKVRLPRLLAVLQRHAPDVVCLQETKCLADNFPYAALRAAGYEAAVVGQKAYNGVAILAKAAPDSALSAVCHGFADVTFDQQARLLQASYQGVRILCVYVPNGAQLHSDKYHYKRQFLARLQQLLHSQYDPSEALLLCGDLNIAPRSVDVAQPEQWENSVLCHPSMRQAFTKLLDWGLHDVGAQQYPQGGVYSWWDYRQLAFAHNHGLRIDHILATSVLANRCQQLQVDRDERRGKQASDHAPVLADFAFN